MTTYLYSRWDGTQDTFLIHEDELMGHLSDQLMAHGDVSSALRSMIQGGVEGTSGQRLSGVQDILQRLRALRQETLEQYDLNSVLENITERLQDIIETEREGIQHRLQEVAFRVKSPAAKEGVSRETGEELLRMLEQRAQRSREYLDQLPADPAGRLQQLNDYEFMNSEAKAKFDALVKSLQQRVLGSHVQELAQRLRNMESPDIEGLKEMLFDLNEMLEQRLQGDSSPDIEAFQRKHSRYFGPQSLTSLDDLIERMQRQMAQMRNLLRSMAPEQRRELQEALDAVFDDPELMEEISQLSANLDALSPQDSVTRDYPFQGDDPLTLEEALDVMERLRQIEEMEMQLHRTQHGGNIAEVDNQLLRELLGEEAFQQLEQLKSLTELLEEAGYIRRLGGRYELTPRGVRRIGEKALQEIFTFIRKDRTGSHPVRYPGELGEWQRESTKRYEFGDAFDPHLHRTLMNAVQRGEGVPLRVLGDDFEVYQPQQVAQASTVLMVDMSLSMAMRGNFLAAKKVALALDNLIRTQFPRDALYIVGFSTYAREVKPERLPYLVWDEFDPYTNIQQGLAVSRKLLSRIPNGGTKQIIMISDGEPTAHLEAGQLFLQYPPSPRTIRETLREVKRCTDRGITINTFMLDRNSYLVEFVGRMTRINRGRVFYTRPERLGKYILVDYVASRRRVLG